MSLNYEKESRLVGFGEKTEQVVSVVRRNETVTSQELIEQIHLRTLLPTQVINAVLNGLTDSLKTYFMNGHGTYITDKFGIMYPRLVKHKKEDGTVSMSVGVGFRPSSDMKQMLSRISIKDITDSNDEDAKDDENDDPQNSTPSDNPDSF